MPAIKGVHSPFFHDFSKKIITRKLYKIKTRNLEHTFSNVAACDIVCGSRLDAEENHTEHREI